MQSEFYRDTSQMEKKLFGISKRQFRALLLYLLMAVIVILEALLLPEWSLFPAAFVTGVLLGVYPTLLLMDKWKLFKRKISLYFLYEERLYVTGQIRRYEKDEFIQEKGIKETDDIY